MTDKIIEEKVACTNELIPYDIFEHENRLRFIGMTSKRN